MSRRRQLAGYIAIGLVVLALIVFLGPAGQGGNFAPRGTSATGLGVVSAAVEDLGGQVDVGRGAPRDSDVVAVVVPGAVSGETVNELADFVVAGGRVVLMDPASPLNPIPVVDLLASDLVGSRTAGASCPLFEGVADAVESDRWYSLQGTAPDPGPIDGPTEAEVEIVASCYRIGTGYGVVVARWGEGEIVVVGGATAFLNINVTKSDNAELALAVLAPTGAERIVYVSDRPGEGDQQLVDVLPNRVKTSFWILVVGVVVGVLAHARRLAPIVDEAPNAQIPGSELALAIGEQMARHGHVDVATARLRGDVRREARQALSLPLGTSPATLAQVVKSQLGRTGGGLSTAEVELALGEVAIAREVELVELASAVAAVREWLQPTAAGPNDGQRYMPTPTPTVAAPVPEEEP